MTAWAIAGGLLGIAALIALWAWRYTKAGPNEVLIVAGRQRTVTLPDGTRRRVGYRLVRGGTFVWPILERAQRLSLELHTLEVQTADAYTAHGVRVLVDAVAHVKIRSDETSIELAAEQFLSKSAQDIRRVAMQTIAGHLRAVVGTMSVEDVYLKRGELAARVREAAARDLARMGMDIVSLTIRHVADEEGYIDALGRPRVAQVKQEAAVAEAEADRIARIARLESDRAVEAARRELEAQRAEADLTYELHKQKVAQTVKREELQVALVEKEMQIKIEEQEIARKQKELLATVELPASAEKKRIEMLAEAERARLESEAVGKAAQIRAAGEAEAEAIRAKGLAEADAMRAKSMAWKEYNDAAITQMVVEILPRLAASIAEPLARTDKIVIVGSNGHGAGASRITGDITEILAQLPTVVESLTGVQLQRLIRRIRGSADVPPAESSSPTPSESVSLTSGGQE